MSTHVKYGEELKKV
ncbi:hypothetical protein T4B_514, partial [Trichinella pseudospiralis]